MKVRVPRSSLIATIASVSSITVAGAAFGQRDYDKLEEARVEVNGDLAVAMDVTQPKDWDMVAELIKEKYGLEKDGYFLFLA